MSIVATTLSAAMTATQTTCTVASTTNITNPNWQTAAGIIYLLIDQEYMLVTSVNTTTLVCQLQRGQWGTAQAAHVSGSLVQSGTPTDYSQLSQIFSQKSTTALQVEYATNLPATFLSGSADAINPAVPGFYEVKTAGVDAMTLAAPPASAEGNIITVVSDTANAHTITATSLFAGGTALKSTATFPAFRGASITLRASNGVWEVLSAGNANTTSFVVLS